LFRYLKMGLDPLRQMAVAVKRLLALLDQGCWHRWPEQLNLEEQSLWDGVGHALLAWAMAAELQGLGDKKLYK
jgi:hypothetical protein